MVLKRTCNDYPEREYTQVSGNGRLPLIIVEGDIVSSVWKHTAVHKRTGNA